MNRKLLDYYLGSLARSRRFSRQCQQMRERFLGDAPSDQARLDRVLEFLDGVEPIEEDTVQWLLKGIRGHYGGEGYVLDIALNDEASFWAELARRYPRNARLCFTAADSRYLASDGDDSETLRLFLQAFDLDPSFSYALEGSVAERFEASPFRLPYQLALLRAAVRSGDEESAREELARLRAEYRSDPEALGLIDREAGGL